MVAHAYNHSDSEGRNWEDHGLRLDWEKHKFLLEK
jgi:hypothetical protein